MSVPAPSRCSISSPAGLTILVIDGLGELSCHALPCDRVVRVRLEGDLDAHTAPSLDERMRSLVESGAHVVVDLTALRFCGCAGLRLFLRWRTSSVASGGSLHLVSASRDTHRAIMLSGLGNALPLVADMTDVVCTESMRLEEPRSADQR